jgi:hypothetical protein
MGGTFAELSCNAAAESEWHRILWLQKSALPFQTCASLSLSPAPLCAVSLRHLPSSSALVFSSHAPKLRTSSKKNRRARALVYDANVYADAPRSLAVPAAAAGARCAMYESWLLSMTDAKQCPARQLMEVA